MSKKYIDAGGIDAPEVAQPTLEDFIVLGKIDAFCRRYKPCSTWREDCDVFNDARLRTYVKAVVCQCGDPLTLYIETLQQRGFKMVDDESGEPVIYALPR